MEEPRTPRFCARCGKALVFSPSGQDRFDIYTGQPVPVSGYLGCPDYRDDPRGDNGHTNVRAEQVEIRD